MWNKLSMQDRAKYIQLGVANGITSLDTIKEVYNKYAEGGNLDTKYDDGGYSKWKRRVQRYKGIDIDNDNTYDYEGYYKSNPSRAWDMLEDKPDAHFTDEFKTSTHPTFSVESRYSGNKNQFNPNGLTGGIWNGDYKYIMSQDMLNNYNGDVSYTRDYLDRYGSGVTIYNPEGDIMLKPAIVRASKPPKKRSKKYDTGGSLTGYNPDDRIISTGNDWVDVGLSFVPFVGSAMDWEEAVRNPSVVNYLTAVGSTALDFFGGSLVKGALKTVGKAKDAADAVKKMDKAKTKYERSTHNMQKALDKNQQNVTKLRKQTNKDYKNYLKAQQEAKELNTYKKAGWYKNHKGTMKRMDERYVLPEDWSRVVNPYTVFGTGAGFNALQYAYPQE